MRECYKPGVVGKILQPEIKSMIDARDFGALREVFREWPPADVAEVILDMPEDEQVIIFRVLPHALAADVLNISIETRSRNCCAPWLTSRS
jgi:Mg/Co/Ni transporter MgtE